MAMSRAAGAAAATGCVVVLLTGCVVVLLTGCGVVSAVTSSFESAHQRANADAASIVSSFVPPEGAVRLDSVPARLSKPMTVPVSPNLVDKTAYWQASGSPQDVLAWEKEQLPSRFTWAGRGSFGKAPALPEESFTLPATTGLTYRTLEITALPEGSRTAIRIDSQVIWVQ